MARIGLFFVLAWMALATLGGFTSAAAGDAPSNVSSSPNANDNNAPSDGSPSANTGASQKGTTQLPEIVVEERSDSMLGIADTSTQGTIGAQELEERPISRPGEVLEAMPGVIVTQHSGDGKANQYFLRGFNLDHGTDMASFFDGIPINLPSNAHGEGYTDLNFLIPELIQKIDYGKGPYYANVGDFGSAGWENIQYFQTLPEGIAKVEVGSWNYERALLADSTKARPGQSARRPGSGAYRRAMGRARKLCKIQRSADLQPGRHKPGLQRVGIGVSRHMECDQPSPGACSRRGPH